MDVSNSVYQGISVASNGISLSNILGLVLIGLLPIASMAMTSYLKVSIVLGILRNALGGGQIPSQAISGILALIISLFTISPVLEQSFLAYSQTEKTIIKESKSSGEKLSDVDSQIKKAKAGFEPLLNFLRLNTHPRERLYFFSLDHKRGLIALPDKKTDNLSEDTIALKDKDITCSSLKGSELESCLKENERIPSLLLSFVVSELRSAFTIGVYLFLPFLVIDLIVSTILTGLGMMMVSPITISLPLKLLLFVVSDGWRALTENLILAYTIPGIA